MVEVNAAYDSMPLHVRAGAIVPVGPEMQYTNEKAADPVTLYVYAGADGAFELYEDDGVTYGYEQGAYSSIPIKWDDRSRTLTIGARAGSFPGMLEARRFEVVMVSPGRPRSPAGARGPVKSVTYTGERVAVTVE